MQFIFEIPRAFGKILAASLSIHNEDDISFTFSGLGFSVLSLLTQFWTWFVENIYEVDVVYVGLVLAHRDSTGVDGFKKRVEQGTNFFHPIFPWE